MTTWNTLATDDSLQITRDALKANGIESIVTQNGQEAKEKVLAMLPKGAEVMTMTSKTLDTIGVSDAINTSNEYNAVKPKLYALDRKTQGLEMQKMGAAPEWSIGSVHAITEDGKVIIASNTGSQLPGYAYGSMHVIWVVGTQKIVKNLDDGTKRVYEHVLPLESDRAHKAYGVPGSFVSKMLIINREVHPGRITVVFVKEELGF